jgi:hypothetical protein
VFRATEVNRQKILNPPAVSCPSVDRDVESRGSFGARHFHRVSVLFCISKVVRINNWRQLTSCSRLRGQGPLCGSELNSKIWPSRSSTKYNLAPHNSTKSAIFLRRLILRRRYRSESAFLFFRWSFETVCRLAAARLLGGIFYRHT